MLVDAKAREQAIDITQSFIVQAPAGSGKTEILTQRFLRLLASVSAPEQIIALTFTRKAAFEMRERIIQALHKARDNVIATSPHQEKTLSYAKAALHQSEQFNWQLIDYPNRLRIMTLDALCQQLNHAIWLSDNPIPYANVTESADKHYESAARLTLEYAFNTQALHPALKTLLLHVDNRQDTLITLLSALLSSRYHWLGLLFEAKGQSKAMLERALRYIEANELNRLNQSLPKPLLEQVLTLAKTLAWIGETLDEKKECLRQWQPGSPIDRDIAAALAPMLLTQEDKYRKGFDHHVGLRRDNCDANTFQTLKKASQELFATLADYPDFCQALSITSALPQPSYSKAQWQVLTALFELLPLLISHLHISFNEQNEVDFNFIAQSALQALGSDEEPTDLTLFLDNSIKHLLVDEFQDTSIQQFQLISRLTSGWEPNDGRTLFVVGDPMQSIYRFRQAEVGLFLRARQHGIGPVSLTPLQLSCNFRSLQPIVQWINQQFRAIFPSKDNIESGAISFHPADFVNLNTEHCVITAKSFDNKRCQAQALVLEIKKLQQDYPNQSIAILVRSRAQLTEITAAFREHQLAYLGVDITLLSTLPHLKEVWSLTKALLMPADRLSWLELLGSSLAGLCLKDIYLIANVDKFAPILTNLGEFEHLPLSDDGKIRAAYLYHVLNIARKSHCTSLTTLVNETLNHLHRDKRYNAREEADLEQFWQLLSMHEKQGLLPNMATFEAKFEALYSKQVTPSTVQIMTIHKSKGLEFDTVFLPGLGVRKQAPSATLLRLLSLPTDTQENLLLLSPLKAANQERCYLYDYLTKIEAEKESFEAQRLLYVATTRAKARLYLFDFAEKITEGSFRALLKNQPFIHQTSPNDESPDTLNLLPLIRLPIEHYRSLPPINPVQNPFITLDNPPLLPKIIGTTIHTLLQWLASREDSFDIVLPEALIKNLLRAQGVCDLLLSEALPLIKTQLSAFLSDPIGQWIIAPHPESMSEYELLMENHGRVATRIIDRTFKINNIRWIIDFKTGQDNEVSQQSHQTQVNEYAHHWSKMRDEPIACGLYYLATGKWIHWDFTKQ